jgi:hypothetical protein
MAPLDGSPTRFMEVNVSIGGGNKNVGVNDQHSAPALHEVVERVTIRNIYTLFSAMKGRQRAQFLFL